MFYITIIEAAIPIEPHVTTNIESLKLNPCLATRQLQHNATFHLSSYQYTGESIISLKSALTLATQSLLNK